MIFQSNESEKKEQDVVEALLKIKLTEVYFVSKQLVQKVILIKLLKIIYHLFSLIERLTLITRVVLRQMTSL